MLEKRESGKVTRREEGNGERDCAALPSTSCVVYVQLVGAAYDACTSYSYRAEELSRSAKALSVRKSWLNIDWKLIDVGTNLQYIFLWETGSEQIYSGTSSTSSSMDWDLFMTEIKEVKDPNVLIQ